jgi:hypothetical protein
MTDAAGQIMQCGAKTQQYDSFVTALTTTLKQTATTTTLLGYTSAVSSTETIIR